MADIINITSLNNSDSLFGLINPANAESEGIVLKEHDGQPVKNLDDVYKISDYLISNGRYRDNMIFIVGINFGLRVSDLRSLRFADLINDNMTFKESFPVFEIKTRKTRKKKQNRYITINDAVKEAVIKYLQNTENVSLSDYMFRSDSNNSKNNDSPISARSINRILDGIKKDLNLPFRFSTHSLRKTFCYHQMAMSGNDPRKLVLLQKMLGHSSMLQTLDYIGITEEEVGKAYKELNLGKAGGSYVPYDSYGNLNLGSHGGSQNVVGGV